MDWSFVIADLRPNDEWTLTDCSDLSTLIWNEGNEPPTREEIESHYEMMLAREA